MHFSGTSALTATLLSVVVLFLLFTGVLWRHDSPGHVLSDLKHAAPSLHDSATSALYNSVSNATLGFQKILVLNLPSRSDNRDAMSLAAAMTGIQVEYIDGVTNFDPENLPATFEGGPLMQEGTPLTASNLGSWRAHMNAIRAIVEQNLTSALILEDDGDWDIRIKSQLHDFARMSRMLLQPIKGQPGKFLDPSNPRTSPEEAHTDIDVNGDNADVERPTSSPYGDIGRWDVLWLGHCGTRFPEPKDVQIPLGRVVLHDDETAPQTQHFQPGYGDYEIADAYPNHSRVVSWARGSVCNLAYGVSLHGARKLLYEMGVANMSSSTDTMLRRICDGDEGRDRHLCVGVRPPLFSHHLWKGFPEPFTLNIRWSTKMNLRQLVRGQTDYYDQYPDE